MRISAARAWSNLSGPELSKRLASVRVGYSLLEVLIVVALLGLAVSISGPSLGRMVERQQAQQTLRAGAAALSELRIDAFVSGTDRSSAAVKTHLDAALSPGWTSDVPGELAFRRSGYCHGGEIRIFEPDGRAWRMSVTDGDCEITDVQPDGRR